MRIKVQHLADISKTLLRELHLVVRRNTWNFWTWFPFDFLLSDKILNLTLKKTLSAFAEQRIYCRQVELARLLRVVRRLEDRRHLRSQWFVARLEMITGVSRKGSSICSLWYSRLRSFYQMNKSGVAQGATFKILCNLIVVFLLFVIVKKHFNCNEFFILW